MPQCWIITKWNRSGIYTIEDSINGKKYKSQKRAETIADKNPRWRNDTVIRCVADVIPDAVLRDEIARSNDYEQNTRNCVASHTRKV